MPQQNALTRLNIYCPQFVAQYTKPMLNVSLLCLQAADPALQLENECTAIYKEDCQNYIRALVKTKPEELLVCGTHAFKPLCRTYLLPNKNNSTVLDCTTDILKCSF
ncbi:hypothetical protein HELRODRAFT_159303 [Helobdella robusta]|uniref:Sema domain-containing protein n=1 Tax=Helobdella robusta TaxID=6412 RepID=T1ENV2_HELRO|nr:hypothetical protein HELRODRAFT_159303 [Helobdella robusta]ESO12716.1 hypothetical protein HELRODRAFT_159303 [Helobdella robusta]